LLGSSPFADRNQKRYADYFEAYIGAAWESARATKDLDQVREIEDFLSQLFKPIIWPALESLANGSTDLTTAIRFDEKLGDGLDNDEGVSIFEIPPARMVVTKKGKKAARSIGKKERKRKLAEIAERSRQLVIVDKFKATKGNYSTPIKYRSQGGPSRASILRNQEAERKWQSAITNRVAMRLSARQRQPYATPIKSNLSQQQVETGSCKIFRLKPGGTVEEEIDMDLDSDWEDVQIVADPGRLTRVDRYVGKTEPGGTIGVPIIM
jgi:hypothetical protein